MKLTFAILVLAVAAMTQTARADGDPAKGAQVFKKCTACHSIGPGAKNKFGPELNGLDGRKAGSVASYNYSAANKSSGVVWNKETFERYIQNPRKMIPRTKMFFPGLKKESEIDNLWAFLKQYKPDGTKK